MKTVLITGINGLAGAHLAKYINSNYPQVEVWGSVRKNAGLELLKELLGAGLEKIKLLECDFNDPHRVQMLFPDKKFEKIFHFAARTPISLSIDNPEQTFKINIIGTLYLLEAIRAYLPQAVVVIPGSSDEYGLIRPEDVPVKEGCVLRPLNPYGVSKVAQSMLGWQYYKSYGLKIVRTRTFSYTGPGQSPDFACSSFARQVAGIELGGEPNIRVGNLARIIHKL